jgi:hypothetical protein
MQRERLLASVSHYAYIRVFCVAFAAEIIAETKTGRETFLKKSLDRVLQSAAIELSHVTIALGNKQPGLRSGS